MVKKLKSFLTVVLVTFLLQLVADHIMRSTLNGTSYLFAGLVAGSMGLLALLLVKMISWRKPQ